MKLLTIFAATALIAVPVLGSAQANLKNVLKVHPRRLAVNLPDGRHQPRLLGRKTRHKTRAAVRTVTHKVTTPHHPSKH